MSKLLIRLTVALTAAYLIACYVAALFGVDIWCQAYYLLFILCVCLCMSAQGVYHCRYVKWTAYAVLVEECVAYSDVLFDYLSGVAAAIIQPTIIVAGIATTAVLSIRHYIKVRRIKKIWRSRH